MIILRSTAVFLLFAGLSLAYPQDPAEDATLSETPVEEYEPLGDDYVDPPNYEEVSPAEYDDSDDQGTEPPVVYDDRTVLEAESEYDYEEGAVDYNAIPEFESEPQTVPVEVGGTAELPCVINQETPHVMIIKKLADKEDGHEPLYFVGAIKLKKDRRLSLKDGVMTLKNVQLRDAGEYVCYYESDPIVEIRHTIDVLLPPTMVAHSEDQRVLKGDSVELNCTATGNPEPKYLWSRIDGRLPDGHREEEEISMTLLNVDRHVEGTYVCKADNGIGEPAEAQIHVAVEYEPEITTEMAIVKKHINQWSKLEIICIVYSRPIAQVTWDINGGTIEIDPNEVEEIEGGHRHALALPLDNQDLYGEVTCYAENIHGNASATETFSEEPSAPEIISEEESREENSYHLGWATDSYTPIEEYNITYYNLNEEIDEESNETGIIEIVRNTDNDPFQVQIMGTQHTIYHYLDDLEPGTQYQVTVQVKNMFMQSETTSFSFTTKSLTTTTSSTTTSTTTTAPTTVKLETNAPTAKAAQSSSEPSGGKNRRNKTNGSSIPSISMFLLLATTLLLQA